MNTIWILVSDSESARLFEVRRPNLSWHVVTAVSSLDDATHDKGHFALTLAKMLDGAARASSFPPWVLVAPSGVAAAVEGALSSELAKRLVTTVDSDMSHLYVHGLKEALRDVVRVILSDPHESVRDADLAAQ
jgi:protein required for attachment to host cells